MKIAITADEEELNVPFPNFAERVLVALQEKYDELKAALTDNAAKELTVTIISVKK